MGKDPAKAGNPTPASTISPRRPPRLAHLTDLAATLLASGEGDGVFETVATFCPYAESRHASSARCFRDVVPYEGRVNTSGSALFLAVAAATCPAASPETRAKCAAIVSRLIVLGADPDKRGDRPGTGYRCGLCLAPIALCLAAAEEEALGRDAPGFDSIGADPTASVAAVLLAAGKGPVDSFEDASTVSFPVSSLRSVDVNAVTSFAHVPTEREFRWRRASGNGPTEREPEREPEQQSGPPLWHAACAIVEGAGSFAVAVARMLLKLGADPDATGSRPGFCGPGTSALTLCVAGLKNGSAFPGEARVRGFDFDSEPPGSRKRPIASGREERSPRKEVASGGFESSSRSSGTAVGTRVSARPAPPTTEEAVRMRFRGIAASLEGARVAAERNTRRAVKDLESYLPAAEAGVDRSSRESRVLADIFATTNALVESRANCNVPLRLLRPHADHLETDLAYPLGTCVGLFAEGGGDIPRRVASALVERGNADVSQRGVCAFPLVASPLYAATIAIRENVPGSVDVFRLLLRNGADVDGAGVYPEGSARTPLIELLRVLKDGGASRPIVVSLIENLLESSCDVAASYPEVYTSEPHPAYAFQAFDPPGLGFKGARRSESPDGCFFGTDSDGSSGVPGRFEGFSLVPRPRVGRCQYTPLFWAFQAVRGDGFDEARQAVASLVEKLRGDVDQTQALNQYSHAEGSLAAAATAAAIQAAAPLPETVVPDDATRSTELDPHADLDPNVASSTLAKLERERLARRDALVAVAELFLSKTRRIDAPATHPLFRRLDASGASVPFEYTALLAALRGGATARSREQMHLAYRFATLCLDRGASVSASSTRFAGDSAPTRDSPLLWAAAAAWRAASLRPLETASALAMVKRVLNLGADPRSASIETLGSVVRLWVDGASRASPEGLDPLDRHRIATLRLDVQRCLAEAGARCAFGETGARVPDSSPGKDATRRDIWRGVADVSREGDVASGRFDAEDAARRSASFLAARELPTGREVLAGDPGDPPRGLGDSPNPESKPDARASALATGTQRVSEFPGRRSHGGNDARRSRGAVLAALAFVGFRRKKMKTPEAETEPETEPEIPRETSPAAASPAAASPETKKTPNAPRAEVLDTVGETLVPNTESDRSDRANLASRKDSVSVSVSVSKDGPIEPDPPPLAFGALGAYMRSVEREEVPDWNAAERRHARRLLT